MSEASGAGGTVLLAQRFERAGTYGYTVAVPVGALRHILPVPDPDVPAPGNRRVSRQHARGFAEYWCANPRWIAPPVLVDTPHPLDPFFEPIASAGRMVVGRLYLPAPEVSGLEILDGQHRVLGWSMVATGPRAQEFERRLRDERITVEILERVGLDDHRQYFFDIASNARGITKSLTASFDKRSMLHRTAQALAVEHPLFEGRVDLQNDRASAGSEHVLSLQNVVDMVAAAAVGIDGWVTSRHSELLDEAAVRDIAESALAVLMESFDVLADVAEDVISPRELRESSLLGSITILRVLLGAFHVLAVDGKRVDPAGESRARAAFVALAPTMGLPVGEAWMATGAFTSPVSRAPTARRQDLRRLVDFVVSYAPDLARPPVPVYSAVEGGDDESFFAALAEDDEAEVGGTPDVVASYRSRINRIPLLSAREEVSLARRIEAGVLAQERLEERKFDSVKERRGLEWLARDGRRAFEVFVEANLRLVVSLAARYTGHGVDLEDLIQEGNLGLIRAVQKFDFRQGNKFSTYATWWIRQAISRALADQGRVVRLPVHVNDDILKVRAAARELRKEGVDRPGAAQIAARVELAVEEVEQLIRWSRPVWSLEEEVPAVPGEIEGMVVESGSTISLGEVVVDDSPGVEELVLDRVAAAERARRVAKVLDSLSEREADVIRSRMGFDGADPQTLDQIGRRRGVSRERIRQIEAKVFEKLREESVQEVLRENWP